MLVKGLPLAYDRDLQEDKLPLFDSVDTFRACLQLAAPMVAGMKFRRESITARLEHGYLDATTLMEYLIGRGLPQRTAHHLVGELVGIAMQRNVPLAELELSDFQALDSGLDETVFDVLGVQNALAAFQSYGSTAPAEVAKQVKAWKKQLEETT